MWLLSFVAVFSLKREPLHTADIQSRVGCPSAGGLSLNILGGLMSPNYDVEVIWAMRRALDEVFADQRFVTQNSNSALEIAEHILWQAANGERDLDRLKRQPSRNSPWTGEWPET